MLAGLAYKIIRIDNTGNNICQLIDDLARVVALGDVHCGFDGCICDVRHLGRLMSMSEWDC